MYADSDIENPIITILADPSSIKIRVKTHTYTQHFSITSQLMEHTQNFVDLRRAFYLVVSIAIARI